MRRISIKAVAAGAAVDLGLTLALAIPVYAWLGMQSGAFSLPEPERADALMAAATEDARAYMLLLLLGCLCSVVGGYVAGAVARRDVLLNGVLSGSLCFVVGTYALVTNTGGIQWWLQVLVLPLGPALGALGGELWSRRTIRIGTGGGRKAQRSIIRRVFVTLLYAGVIFVVISLSMARLISASCLEAKECTPNEDVMLMIVGWLLIFSILGVAVAGPMGLLPGARRSRATIPEAPETREPSCAGK